MAGFKVVHLDSAFNPIGEVPALNLRFGKSLEPPGFINYDIPLNNPLARQLLTRPYRTYFRLYTESGQSIMGGFHTEVQIDDYPRSKLLRVAGKDWLYYLDHVIWPKDPMSSYRSTTFVDPTNGTVFDYTGSVDYVAYKLIVEAINDSGLADQFTYFFSGGIPSSGGSAARLRIEPGDTTTIGQHLDNLLALGTSAATPYIKCAPTRHIDLTGNVFPTYGTSTPVTFKFSADLRGGNCEVVSFRHGGIRGTRVIGIAQGPSSKKAYIAYAGSSNYGRWDIVEEFSSPNAYANLANLTIAEQNDALIPDIEVTLKVPDSPEMGGPWLDEIVFPGARVQLQADLGWLDLNDNFTVTAIECDVPNDAASVYTITLNQPQATT